MSVFKERHLQIFTFFVFVFLNLLAILFILSIYVVLNIIFLVKL